ncbi:MAG: MFS transporter [Pseudomonadales bacterium]
MALYTRIPFFYGWVIVAATFVLQFISVGLSYYTFSIFLKPLALALETDRFTLSWTMSIQIGVMAVLSPLAGKWFATLPIRRLLTAGVICLSLGYLSLTQVTAVWQLYLLYGVLIGIGAVLLGVIPCNVLLANWFERRRGTAMGISQFGISISGTLLVPAVTWVLVAYGWQTAFGVSAVVAALVLLPLIGWLVIRTPEEIGLSPDNEAPLAIEANADTTDWTFWKAVTHRDIWLLTLTIGPCYLGIASVILAMPSHITDMGIDPLDAAAVLGLTTFLAACAKPLFGIVSDFISKKIAAAIAILLQATGVFLLLTADVYLLLLGAGACFGLGYGAMAPLWGLMLAQRFGRHAFAKIMGANQPMLMPFSMLGLPITTFVFETTGSYIPAFTGLLAGYAVALLSIFLFRMSPTAR